MVGSLKYFVYRCDDGTEFAIKRDETNTEGGNVLGGRPAGENDFTATSLPIYEIPRNVTPRYVVFSSPDNRVTRTLTCLTLEAYAGITNTDSITIDVDGVATALSLARKRGEKLRVPRADDTGLNDGDAT